jgi:hypothetical protein
VKAKRLVLKANAVLQRELKKTRDWFHENHKRLPDFAFHSTSLSDARKMVKEFKEKGKYGRFFAHFFYAGPEARQSSAKTFFNRMLWSVSGLVGEKESDRGALILVQTKKNWPIEEERGLEKEKLAVTRDLLGLGVKSAHVLSFSKKEAGEVRRLFGKLDSEAERMAFEFARRRLLMQKMIAIFERQMKKGKK